MRKRNTHTWYLHFDLDIDTQKELLRETVSSTKKIDIAIDMYMGAQNQKKIKQNLNTNAQSVNIVNKTKGPSRSTNYQQNWKDFTRYPAVPQNYRYTSTCATYCQRWSDNNCQLRPAKRKNSGNFRPFCQKMPKSQENTFSNSTAATNICQQDRRNSYQKWWWGVRQLHYQLSTTIRATIWLQFWQQFRLLCCSYL